MTQLQPLLRPSSKGIGIGRITANFKASQLDGALRCSDGEAIDMCYYLLQHEGKCAPCLSAKGLCDRARPVLNMGIPCRV